MTERSLYTITIRRSAEKELDALPALLFDRISQKILALEEDPRPKGCKKLRDTERYRVRVGSYRILYQVDDAKRLVDIVAVGHRRDVYNG